MSDQPGPPEPDLQRALALAMEMMAIPGRSGEEAVIADFVDQRLRAAGAPATAISRDNVHQRTVLPGNAGNLVLKLPGTRRAPRRLLTAHLDTVPVCVGSQPVRRGRVVRSANRATGLGADDRAGAAAILSAALEILEHGLSHPPLTFCWFVQEEVGMHGARLVSKALLGNPRLAFNWDGWSPTRVSVGATGGCRVEVDVRGVASHAGGAPREGVSAIAVAARAIADLDRRGWHGLVEQGRRRGTANVGIIEGGSATNVVADHVTVVAEARSHDPRFRQRIVDEVERSFQRAAGEIRNLAGTGATVKVATSQHYEAFKLGAREPSVLAATAAIEAVGGKPVRGVENGGLDSNRLAARGIGSVTMGCGQRHAHTVDEELDIADFETACRVALVLATGSDTQARPVTRPRPQPAAPTAANGHNGSGRTRKPPAAGEPTPGRQRRNPQRPTTASPKRRRRPSRR